MVRNGSVLTPKRRGRPPKSAAVMVQTPLEANTNKRRGRPPGKSKVTAVYVDPALLKIANSKQSRTKAKSAPKLYFVYNFDADATFIVMADDGQTARTQVYDMIRQGIELEALDNLQELAAKKGCSARVLLKTEVITHVKDNIYHMS